MNRFSTIIADKVNNKETQSLQEDPSDRDEIKALMRPGLYWGVGASVLTFTFLRRAPRLVLGVINRRGPPGSSSSTTSAGSSTASSVGAFPFSAGTKGGLSPFSNLVQQGAVKAGQNAAAAAAAAATKTTVNGSGGAGGEPKVSSMAWFVMMVVDLMVSIPVGLAVWNYNTPQEKVVEAFSRIPLSPGRSTMSETFCADFIACYRDTPQRVWRENADVGTIVALKAFVDNCRRRQAMEREIRAETMLPNDAPVLIPATGVPADLALLDDNDIGVGDDTDNDGSGGGEAGFSDGEASGGFDWSDGNQGDVNTETTWADQTTFGR